MLKSLMSFQNKQRALMKGGPGSGRYPKGSGEEKSGGSAKEITGTYASPKSSPWGKPDQTDVLANGIFWVGTPGHGGMMISNKAAEQVLSPEAIAQGEKHGSFLAYEEDAQWAIPQLELQAQGIMPKDKMVEEDKLMGSLSRWNADYLEARGIKPVEKDYEYYKARKEDEKLRAEKSPDLIVSASSVEGKPEQTEVWTADGKKHIVEGYSTERERAGARGPRLSNTKRISTEEVKPGTPIHTKESKDLSEFMGLSAKTNDLSKGGPGSGRRPNIQATWDRAMVHPPVNQEDTEALNNPNKKFTSVRSSIVGEHRVYEVPKKEGGSTFTIAYKPSALFSAHGHREQPIGTFSDESGANRRIQEHKDAVIRDFNSSSKKRDKAIQDGDLKKGGAGSGRYPKGSGEDKGRPEPGKQYALTGGSGQPSIASGNTWKESEVKPVDEPKEEAPKPAEAPAEKPAEQSPDAKLAEQKAKMETMIDEFAKDPDVVQAVKQFESGVKTTKDNYGKYMAFLSPYAKNPVALHIISQAMMRAGGNANGIRSAMGLITGKAFN